MILTRVARRNVGKFVRVSLTTQLVVMSHVYRTQVEHEIGGGERVDESGQYFAHARHHSDEGVVDLQHVTEHADREHRACTIRMKKRTTRYYLSSGRRAFTKTAKPHTKCTDGPTRLVIMEYVENTL